MTTLTIFTAPKPFVNPHIAMIQRNAILSWKELGDLVQVFLIGDEEGIGEAAREMGVGYIPEVDRNPSGVPLISSIFAQARKQSDADLLAYVNADIILLPDFLQTAQWVAQERERFLVVGQRWDLDVRKTITYGPGWQTQMRRLLAQEGQLHGPYGSDYFIFPRACYRQIPEFAVGRAGWDNWMLFQARWMGWPLINATHSIDIIHQQHDYSHLPGGQPHYRHPDSDINIRLAGGPWTIFTLQDCNYYLQERRICKFPLNAVRFWREVEIFPVRLRSRWLGRLFYAIFHPKKTYGALRNWLRSRKKLKI